MKLRDLIANHLSKTVIKIGRVKREDSEPLESRKTLRKWMEGIGALSAEARNLELLVGVQGATGAGKTSLLNALLGYRDLLPSNSAVASTATICKVSYNHSDDPDKKFHAKVHLRTYENVRAELDCFFENLKKREQLLQTDSQQTDEDENEDGGDTHEERARAVEELNTHIQDTADKIQAVWKYSMKDLTTMSTNDLLQLRDPVLGLLSEKMLTVLEADEKAFGKKIRPYLDSTPMVYERGDTRSMAVWPLVDHVEVFLKTDLLKNGTVLVDLPGLSDVVESRAAVAQSFYDKLALTIVVTPSVRAAAERTGMTLMTKYQEIAMRMDGKLDSHGFCIVCSKTDDIDWINYLESTGEQSELDRIKNLHSQKEVATKTLDSKEEELRILRSLVENHPEAALGIDARIEKLNESVNSLAKGLRGIDKAYADLEVNAVFKAIHARNELSKTRILEHLEKRHDEFQENCPNLKADFTPPKVSPASEKAFWKFSDQSLLKDDVIGFPTVQYTGIPNLVRWIHDATAPRQERHALSILHRYKNLLRGIETWSDCVLEKPSKAMSMQDATAKILEPQSEMLGEKLQAEFTDLKSQVAKCNPLRRKKPALALCVNRNGGPFISQSRGGSQRYDWMEDLSMAFKTNIAAEWSSQLYNKIPPLEDPVKDKVGKALMDLLDETSALHPRLKKRLAETWESAFTEAQDAPGGQGPTKRRHRILKDFSQRHGKYAYGKAVENLQKNFSRRQSKLSRALEGASEHGAEALKSYTCIIIGKVAYVESPKRRFILFGVSGTERRMDRLKKAAGGVVSEWANDWNEIETD
ncbi:hypothetical protein QBC35DRAFT_452299 [Podospora australis]|uniref:Dynamin N-terminal domain-containing protein n=1 Tax=Podospora australis TaxID=1536484 RepID=A0AAN6WSQ6_9PEZI|nr:hypothetical protein QBC35DRAFT_452299 [Podospora australis]